MSWVFSGCSGFLPQGKLTGWVRINIVRKVIASTIPDFTKPYPIFKYLEIKRIAYTW
jgi:hypothetical protein